MNSRNENKPRGEPLPPLIEATEVASCSENRIPIIVNGKMAIFGVNLYVKNKQLEDNHGNNICF